ncbi:MAG: Type IIS restriction enzyme Eco57I [Acidobacteria bacterium ADurb.Bin051]|jgi:hypothetical protein|nr:MAG: Type IIS restriction enzyme Eco57I [Acidobacteria bacterium ADurb.Bin051]
MSPGKAQARAELAALVEEFRDLHGRGLTQGESEATARTWVERLLTVFGWNPADPRQVRQEYTIQGREARRLRREGTMHRRPDYALMVGTERVLYIDVKRIGIAIREDDAVAFQVRSYGWSAGMRLSYACDFEELAVWDCRSAQPRADDDARVCRLCYLHFTEYLDQFDRLWQYLSREAILGGSLQVLHPDDERRRGVEPLDVVFEAKLSDWRVELAKSILRYGKVRDPEIISAAAQRILDRIVFLRFCEELGLEEYGSLQQMASDPDGFWPLFMESHERRYRSTYDGILFPHREEDDPSGVEAHLRQWWLRGRVFQKIVRSLYHPQPYRFDAVPLELLGGIYERFLGKRLRVVGNDVRDEFKPEYQRTRGAVYTPQWVVRRVVERTLEPLTRGRDPDEILALRVLDPACGSASFLLGVYDHLERALLEWATLNPRQAESRGFVFGEGNGPRLGVADSRRIIEECLYGVDIDPNAVEVARMSLALRHLERAAVDLPDRPTDLLAGIGRNIRQGNSLVGPEIAGLGFDPEVVERTMPFPWTDRRHGFGDVISAGGFDAVVGNPPYIEVKRYREWMPEMYRYLKESGRFATVDQGKTDIAMPFLEVGASHLRPGGRLGYIVQTRFFRTEYGASTRRWLHTGNLLEAVEEFGDLQVFPGRTTYTGILVLQPGSRSVDYRSYGSLAAAEAGVPATEGRIPLDQLADTPWALDQPDLLAVYEALAERHGTIGDHRDLAIHVGLQTLYGKLYQLRPVAVTARTVRAVNGLGAEVALERGALRPLCRNRGFYPFRADNADAWVIFPYEIERGTAREIRFPELRQRFPKTAAYLEENRATLRRAVEVPEGRDRWHLYTRPQNLVAQAQPKVLFPSTIEDSIAAVDEAGDIYQDNVRINALTLRGAGVSLRSVAALFNSSVFSALARCKAGLSDAGWRQFNRQFAALVPFPLAALAEPKAGRRLGELARSIASHQERLREAGTEGRQVSLRGALGELWRRLDDEVEKLYGLTPAEREVVRRYPRKVDRVDLVLRAQRGEDAVEES